MGEFLKTHTHKHNSDFIMLKTVSGTWLFNILFPILMLLVIFLRMRHISSFQGRNRRNNRPLFQFSSVTQSCPTLRDPMGCSTPGLPVHHQLSRVYSNSCPLCRWCHPTISSSVIPFSSCLQSFPASGSFQMSQLFASGGQSIGEFQLQHQSFQWFRTDFL